MIFLYEEITIPMQAIKVYVANAPLKMRKPLLNSMKSNYHIDPLICQFTNLLMKDGKKQKSLNLIMSALQIVQEKSNQDSLTTLETAVRNAQPIVGLKKRKQKNKIELQPKPLQEKQGKRMSILWIIAQANKRKESSFKEKLAMELIEASNNKSEAVNQKLKLHDEAIKCRSLLSRIPRLQNK